MMVTDQINALRALGTDPVRKLVVPRLLAGFFMTPVLTVIADAVGIVGGWIIAVTQLRVASSVYWNSIIEGLYMEDAWQGLIKPFFLGFRHRHDRLSCRPADARRHPRCGPGNDQCRGEPRRWRSSPSTSS